MYHALLGGLLEAIEAVIALDKQAMQNSLIRLKQSTEIASKQRKSRWVGKWLFKADYDSFTEEEVHAELVYADSLIFTAVVSVLSDQSILGFLNAALCVKTSYQSYQECQSMLKLRTNWQSAASRMHFENGVRMALGAFDLMISCFPAKFIKLLEFAGFSGKRELGVQELKAAESITGGLRWPVAAMMLAGYNLFLEYVYGLAEPDVQLLEKICEQAKASFSEVSKSQGAIGKSI